MSTSADAPPAAAGPPPEPHRRSHRPWARPARHLVLLAALCGAGAPVTAGAYSAAVAVARPSPADASLALERTGPDRSAQAPRLAVGRDGRSLDLTGTLDEGLADRVAAVLAAHPRIERLDLTSEGGLVEEARALGALVGAYRLATSVRETCASACTLVFVRGRGRFLAQGAHLGFHGPYETGLFEEVRQVDPAPERRAYLNAGLTADFVARALAVRADGMWMPGAGDLRAAGVVTEVVARDRFGDGVPPAGQPEARSAPAPSCPSRLALRRTSLRALTTRAGPARPSRAAARRDGCRPRARGSSRSA